MASHRRSMFRRSFLRITDRNARFAPLASAAPVSANCARRTARDGRLPAFPPEHRHAGRQQTGEYRLRISRALRRTGFPHRQRAAHHPSVPTGRAVRDKSLPSGLRTSTQTSRCTDSVYRLVRPPKNGKRTCPQPGCRNLSATERPPAKNRISVLPQASAAGPISIPTKRLRRFPVRPTDQ